MRPGLVVMADEVAQHMSQVPFVHDDDVVEALSAEGADQTFSDSVRLRRGDWRQHRLDADPSRPSDEVAAIGTVSITNQETRPGAPKASR